MYSDHNNDYNERCMFLPIFCKCYTYINMHYLHFFINVFLILTFSLFLFF